MVECEKSSIDKWSSDGPITSLSANCLELLERIHSASGLLFTSIQFALRRGQRGLRHHLQLLLTDGAADRIGRRVDRDLKLLVPQLGLMLFDLVVQLLAW